MGAGKSWSKMIDIWSWTSLLVKTRSQLSMYLIFCVHSILKCFEAGHHTLDTAFKKMEWSFTACYEGRRPTKDWNGKDIPGAKAGTVNTLNLVFVLQDHNML